MRALSTFDLNQVSGGQFFNPDDIMRYLKHREAKEDGAAVGALAGAIAFCGCMYFRAPTSAMLLTVAAASVLFASFGYNNSDAWNI